MQPLGQGKYKTYGMCWVLYCQCFLNLFWQQFPSHGKYKQLSFEAISKESPMENSLKVAKTARYLT
jgi:hypothetical protein